MQLRTIILLGGVALAPNLLHAQFDFKLAGRELQVHSFASEGFAYSSNNNYLSMKTKDGSWFTDGGANISTQITDKFRVGAQVYFRNIGEFGNWHPQLDWALADYRFARWFGVRGGKVKTVMGLYNDIQDMDSLHTFAMLPESMYPTDWRAASIAHNGGDVYGDIDAKKFGTFSYTAYAGMRPQDLTQGYIYASRAMVDYSDLGGRHVGGDVRWTTPFGAVFGTSYRNQDLTGHGTYLLNKTPYSVTTNHDNLMQYYGQYTLKDFRVDVEYRRNARDANLNYKTNPMKSIVDHRAWYVAGTYRFSKNFDLGAYRSVYIPDQRKATSPVANHQYDTVVAGRINFNKNFYLKAEGHFLDGAPNSPTAARGFYNAVNPGGLLPTTRLLVLRTGFAF